MTRPLRLFFGIVVAMLTTPSLAEPLRGINISGGEFGGVESGALIPTPAEVQSYYDSGFRLFRIPFKAGQMDSAREKLVSLGEKCVALRTPCIFDRHEYQWPAVASQVTFWTRFTKAMPQSDLIQIDVMNEPKGFDSIAVSNDYDQWAQDSQTLVLALRAAGVTNRIWLEWPQSSAAFRFDKSERPGKACESAACALRKLSGGTIVDPLGRTGLQAHRYPDKNNSGSNDYCYPYANVLSFAQQAVPFGMPVMVGEMAFGSDRGMRASCADFGAAVLAEIAAAPNFYGVTWWGGGKAWKKTYLFHTPANATLAYVKMLLQR